MVMLWTELVNTHTIEEYNEKLTAFIDKYEVEYSELIVYLRNTYLIYKHEFCKAWTKNIYYYEVRIIPLLESLYGALKTWIQISTLNLDLVLDQIQITIDMQLKRIYNSAVMESTYISTYSKPSIIVILPLLLH